MYKGRYLEKSEADAYMKDMERQRQRFLKQGIFVSSAKSIKLFDGKQYRITYCSRNKTDVTRFTKMLRDRGNFARIVSYKEGYCVYWRLGW